MPPIALLTGLALLATVRGAYRIALGLTVVVASAAQWVAGLGPPGDAMLAALARARWEYLLAPLLLIVLIGQPAPARVRVWPWLAVLVLTFGSASWHSHYPLRFWGTIALLLATALWATIDPRVPIAAAFLLLPIVLDQVYVTAYPLISAATSGTGVGDPGLFLANGLYLAALAAGAAMLLGVSRRRIRRHGQM